MDVTIIVAVITLAGTIASGIFSMLITNSLIKYRLQKLEEKVDKHNNLIDRMYRVEERVEILEVKNEIK